MDGINVSVRPTDHEYHITVDGMENAKWLAIELSRAFIFKSARPIDQEQGTTSCSFQVPFSAMLPFSTLRRLLAALPRVMLVVQPAVA